MPKFSKESVDLLAQTKKPLQDLFSAVVNYTDCQILPSTIRTKEQQEEYVKKGGSKTMESKHLTGDAVDIMPYPVQWPDEPGISPAEIAYRWKRIFIFAGVVLGIAHTMGIKVRWGGDWDSDWDFKDQTFNDLPHFELVDG